VVQFAMLGLAAALSHQGNAVVVFVEAQERREVTIETFSPTSLFRSVDFPELGRPMRETKPDLWGLTFTSRSEARPRGSGRT
jgi:hypothetical protein